MEKTELFEFLSTQEPSVLLKLLSSAYDLMDRNGRQAVFGRLIPALPPSLIDGDLLLDEVEEFHRQSLAGKYYAPFNKNSKNWMHVPEKTEEWFARLGDLLRASSQLTAQGEHVCAATCFGMLYELIDAMESGKEIVFAEEVGGWMIPGDEKRYIAAFMTSLATVATPDEFTTAALPLIQRDSRQSFATQAYASAMHAAHEVQRTHLAAEISRRKLKTGIPT